VKLPLKDGRVLRTLQDARLIATFDGISHWPALEHARDPAHNGSRDRKAERRFCGHRSGGHRTWAA
jgi:hypothetical protein